jgi:uncharacterized protein YqfA (UPF0365 family)
MHAASFILGFTACLLLLLILRILAIFGPWAKALTCGAHIPLATIFGMRLRGTNTRIFVDAYVRLKQRNKNPSILEMERAYILHKDRIHTAEDLIDFAMDEPS